MQIEPVYRLVVRRSGMPEDPYSFFECYDIMLWGESGDDELQVVGTKAVIQEIKYDLERLRGGGSP